MSTLAALLRHDAGQAVLWIRVGALGANHEACETCDHLALERDGLGLFEQCTLGRSAADAPTDCPALLAQSASLGPQYYRK